MLPAEAFLCSAVAAAAVCFDHYAHWSSGGCLCGAVAGNQRATCLEVEDLCGRYMFTARQLFGRYPERKAIVCRG